MLVVGAPSYPSLRSSAERIPSIGRFLESYVENCESNEIEFDRQGCMDRFKANQRKFRDRLLLLEVEDPSDRLTFAEYEPSRQAYRLHLAPLFSERALALSIGKPVRMTDEGYPVVKNIPIWVKLPAGESDFSFRRQLERGMVRLEILFRPKGTWQLAKSGHVVRGVEGALVGIRVQTEREQTILAEQTY